MINKQEISLCIDDIDYVCVNDLLDNHPEINSNILFRKDIVDKIFTYGKKKYMEYDDCVKLFDTSIHEKEYYTIIMVKRLLQLNTHCYINDMELVLSHFIDNKIVDGTYYFDKEQVKELANELSKETSKHSYIISKAAKQNMIHLYDFFTYWRENKIDLYNTIEPSTYLVQMLFNKNELKEINNNICIKGSIKNLQTILNKKSNLNGSDFFRNYIQSRKNMDATYELLLAFHISRINETRTKNIYDLAIKNTALFERFYNSLRKDIFLYTQEELLDEILSLPNCNNKIILHFFRYVKNNGYPNFAKDIEIVPKHNFKKSSIDYYTKEEWLNFYDYITNEKLHLSNAYSNSIYAQYWLVMLIYLTNAIRISDITNTRGLALYGEKYIKENYFLNNTIPLGISQAIVNLLRSELESSKTIKTNTNIHFYFKLDMVETLAKAICICEYHRVKENNKKLFTIKGVDKDRINKRFKNIPIDFVTTKATKTVLNLVYEENEKNNNNNAYNLVSTMRSHKSNGTYSETTMIYLQEAALSEEIEEVCYNICHRGVFGWLYLAMLEYANGKINSLEEATDEIEKLKQKISPNALENLADFLNNEQRQRKIVLKELSIYSKDNIINFLKNIGKGFTSSKQDTLYCIKGQTCEKYNCEECLFCKYSMPSTYTLELLGTKLDGLIEKLNNTSYSNKIERIKYTHEIYQIIMILKDAKVVFDKYDKNFIGNFVDLSLLNEKLNSIADSKFLYLENKNEEEKNG